LTVTAFPENKADWASITRKCKPEINIGKFVCFPAIYFGEAWIEGASLQKFLHYQNVPPSPPRRAAKVDSMPMQPG
jgi:hypothetical protein